MPHNRGEKGGEEERGGEKKRGKKGGRVFPATFFLITLQA